MSEAGQHAPGEQAVVDEPETEIVANVAPAPTLGELMIEARERWNLSAGDIARQLRLGLRQVEALEANRFESLPGNTFVRGFIRNYAKVVQTEPSILLEAYERSRPQIAPPEIAAQNAQIDFTAKPIPKWVWYIGGGITVVVLAPLVVYLALQDDEPAVKVALPTVAPKAANEQPGQAHEIPLALPPAEAVSLGAAALPTAPGDMAQGVSSPPAALPSAASSEVSSAALKLVFEGSAWVEIRDKSGKKIFSQLSRAGSEQVVQGEPPLSLIVGDAAKVRITYNGNPVNLAPYIKKTVARLTLE